MLDDRGPALLSVCVRYAVVVLRDELYARALHFKALKTAPDLHGPLRAQHLPFL
jgi:hypothetical protein